MKRSCIAIVLLLLGITIRAQEFLPIWEGVKIPNSKGVVVKDSLDAERIFQVGIPGVYVFAPSKAENKGTAVLIIPGGGYARLAYDISGFQLAKWFNTFGVTAFVLNHRLPHSPDLTDPAFAPLQDAQRAMKFIRSRAEEWNIDINKVGVMGSSAGGHLSVSLSTIWEDHALAGDGVDKEVYRPDFAILISPVVTFTEEQYVHKGSRENLLGKNASPELVGLFSSELQVKPGTPPTFLVHASDDTVVPCMNSILYYTALKQNGDNTSTLHIFPGGAHRISLRDNPGTTDYWSVLAEKWMREIGVIK